MKEFENCFIGIPLPSEYLGEFGDLLKKIGNIDPEIKLTDPTTLVPHLTICYLDKQSRDNLREIEAVIKKHIGLIKEMQLKINGVDTFGDGLPWVLFLPIEFPSRLATFSDVLATNLSKYLSGKKNLPFHPHMTVARFTDESRVKWEVTKAAFDSQMSKINWQFPITEVVIFGVDSQTPELHQKLSTIKV